MLSIYFFFLDKSQYLLHFCHNIFDNFLSIYCFFGITMVYGTPYGFSDNYMFILGVSTNDMIALVEIVEMG